MISVITPTVRVEGLKLVAQALQEQTFTDFEWLVGSPREIMTGMLRPKARFVKDPPKPEGYFWSLNRGYNELIRQAKGELIVSWQDWTYADPEALEKFWFYFTHGHDKTLISGVGNKYKDDTWKEIVWKDPRERSDQGSFYPCMWTDVEFNFCSVPKAAFYAVGGFDEELDRWAGMDHISVQERLLDAKGWEFYLDQTNKSYSLEHGRLPEWDEKHNLKGHYMERKAELKAQGVWPLLKYL